VRQVRWVPLAYRVSQVCADLLAFLALVVLSALLAQVALQALQAW
jgi:hypothetical protein